MGLVQKMTKNEYFNKFVLDCDILSLVVSYAGLLEKKKQKIAFILG